MIKNDTIVALSSGNLPSGIAIIRISGPKVEFLLNKLTGSGLKPKLIELRNIIHNDTILDRGLVTYFAAPNSFTGENVCELHLHGSVALVKAVLDACCSYEGIRLAKAGEFTNRAFINGKLDLVEVEGISDLLAAETETQRVQAFARMSGDLSNKINSFRRHLLSLRSILEAQLDFSDESDVDDGLPDFFKADLDKLIEQLSKQLDGATQGRIIRSGFRVALAGKPNAGKSSLINALSKSDLAIVSHEEGTTRDVREVPMDIDGQFVIFIDMAGLRYTSSDSEAQGVKRAEEEILKADLVLWLYSPEVAETELPAKTSHLKDMNLDNDKVLKIGTKCDLGTALPGVDMSISSKNNIGIDKLLELIKSRIHSSSEINPSEVLLSRARDIEAIEIALQSINLARANIDTPEICAEYLRQASNSLERLLGIMNPEQILGEIFSNFCIGK